MGFNSGFKGLGGSRTPIAVFRQQQTAPAGTSAARPPQVLSARSLSLSLHPQRSFAVLRDTSCEVCAYPAMAYLSVHWEYVVASSFGVGKTQVMALRQEIRLALFDA